LGALTTASLIGAGCAPKEEAPAPTATPAPKAEAPTATPVPPEAEAVTLEIGSANPEYENAERQIWDLYEEENSNVTIEMFSVNEDTEAAMMAKIAGGYRPKGFAPTHYLANGTPKELSEILIDLGTIDFPWWDRFTHDPLNKVPELYGFGPYCINSFIGFVFTWQYHKDLMEEAGLDPRNDVKTWDDMLAWIAAGTEWANSTDEVDYFWDQAWHNWVVGSNYMRIIPLAYPDGQQGDMYRCWVGDAKFNDANSPFRYPLEFFKMAYDEGWIPENWWTREWETDMEASYIAKKSVMMLHGPWPWDKMLASDPTAQQEGIPATPPAEGQSPWVQYLSEPNYVGGQACVLKGTEELPEWNEIVKAFGWYHSPEVIAMRAEVLGRPPMYDLGDITLDLSGPQWSGVVKDIGTPGGLWEDVEYTTETWGELVAGTKQIAGSPGTWDFDSGAMVEPFSKVMKGDMSVQEFLDWGQKNWEESYEF
jgi:hypothetical protein